MAGKLPSGRAGTFKTGSGGKHRSPYQTPAAKGGEGVGHKSGSKGRSSYQSLASSPKGKNART